MNQMNEKELRAHLQEAIDQKDDERAKALLSGLHSVEIADLYDKFDVAENRYLYMLLDGEKAADVLMELSEEERQKWLKEVPSDVIARQFVHNMDSDDAADLLGELKEERKDEVLSFLEDVEQAGDIVDLLHYDEDSAGGLMGKEMIVVNENWSMPTCLKEMRKQAEFVEHVYSIYVVNDDDVLVGVLPLKKMLVSPNVSKVKNIAVTDDLITVKTDTSKEEVAQLFEKFDLVVLPVVDAIGRLEGRITVDDVVDVIREEAEKDYQMASGISQDVETTDAVLKMTKARLPWLIIGLIGGVGSAWVVKSFETSIVANPMLAIYVPLIAAMGGNTGIQSSAIVVKSLAANLNSYENVWGEIYKEGLVSSLNALVLSTLLFLYNWLVFNDLVFAMMVSISLFIVVVFASIFGTVIPLVLNRFKIDPALATGPFITTSNDIIGLIIYFTIGGLSAFLLL